MKKLMLLLAVVVTSAMSANAQKEKEVIVSAGDAKSITIGSDLNVVFIPNQKGTADATISKEAMQKLTVSFENGALLLEPKKQMHETVYVVINKPVKVTIGENTTLASQGVLRGNIDLYVNAGAKANLKTSGKLNAYPVGDVDVYVIRTLFSLNATATIE